MLVWSGGAGTYIILPGAVVLAVLHVVVDVLVVPEPKEDTVDGLGARRQELERLE